jgi:hypothetical protein
MGSKKLKAIFGKLKFFTSAFQCGIVHKTFTIGHFWFSSTNNKRRQVSSDDTIWYYANIDQSQNLVQH